MRVHQYKQSPPPPSPPTARFLSILQNSHFCTKFYESRCVYVRCILETFELPCMLYYWCSSVTGRIFPVQPNGQEYPILYRRYTVIPNGQENLYCTDATLLFLTGRNNLYYTDATLLHRRYIIPTLHCYTLHLYYTDATLFPVQPNGQE